MKKINILLSVVLVTTLIFGVAISANGAVIDASPLSAQSDAAVIAADFDISGTTLTPSSPLPSSYSSKDMGFVNPVRQQHLNNCWTYGSLAAFETTVNKRGNRVDFFSPLHMTYWATPKSDGTGWQRDYSDGGYSFISMGYLTSWQGPRPDAEFPDDVDFSDYDIYDESSNKIVGANSVIYLDATDRDTIKTAIKEYGAVVGNYSCDDSNYLNTRTYAYYCNQPGLATAQLNGHCIALVGWDDNYSRSNFLIGKQPTSDGAWLCKNSWSQYWGNAGYFWISYEDMYLFDTRFGYSYAITDYQRIDNNDVILQNEEEGATYEFEYITNMNYMVYMNIFDITENNRIIDKINFETTSQGAKYSLYYIPLDATEKPVTDQSQWQSLSTGYVDYKGYISVDIDDVRLPAGKGAIAVQLDKVNSSGNSIGVCEWLASGNNYIFKPQTKQGNCYFAYSSTGNRFTLLETQDFYSNYLDDDIGGTFVIKAVTSKDYLIGDTNADGAISIMDVTIIQRYLADLSVPDTFNRDAADTTGDRVTSIMDATNIQRHIACYETIGNIGEYF